MVLQFYLRWHYESVPTVALYTSGGKHSVKKADVLMPIVQLHTYGSNRISRFVPEPENHKYYFPTIRDFPGVDAEAHFCLLIELFE